MGTIENGMLDGIDIDVLRDGELDAVCGGGYSMTKDKLSGVTGATNIEAMSVWRELCYQNFGRTF